MLGCVRPQVAPELPVLTGPHSERLLQEASVSHQMQEDVSGAGAKKGTGTKSRNPPSGRDSWKNSPLASSVMVADPGTCEGKTTSPRGPRCRGPGTGDAGEAGVELGTERDRPARVPSPGGLALCTMLPACFCGAGEGTRSHGATPPAMVDAGL